MRAERAATAEHPAGETVPAAKSLLRDPWWERAERRAAASAGASAAGSEASLAAAAREADRAFDEETDGADGADDPVDLAGAEGDMPPAAGATADGGEFAPGDAAEPIFAASPAALRSAAPPGCAAATVWTEEAAAQCLRLLEALVLDSGLRWGDGGLMPWQRDAFAATLGLPGNAARERTQVWVEGPTGCGKDQLIAAVCLAALRFAPPGFEMVNYSADLDRCRDLVKTVRGFIQRTDERAEERGIPRWLGEGITILRDEIRREVLDERGRLTVRAVARIESLDGYSASGARADLFIANEVQSWPDPHGERVWDEALARYDKLPHGRFAVYSNAPFTPVGDFRRDQRERAAAGGAGSPWHFIPVAVEDCPWITPERVRRKSETLAPHVFRRLYLCLPSDGRGELLPPAVFDRAVDPSWRPAAPAGRCWHGLDIGVTRDHAVHVVIEREPVTGLLRLQRVRIWTPPARGQIQLEEVEAEVAASLRTHPGRLLADPYQAVQMCQSLARAGFDVRQVAFTAENLTRMCEAVRSAFNDRRIVVFPDAGAVCGPGGGATSLRRQVLEAEVVESERGSRIKSRRGRGGHGDQLSALALALLGAAEEGTASIPVVASPVERPPALPRRVAEGGSRRGLLRPHAGRFLGARGEARSCPSR